MPQPTQVSLVRHGQTPANLEGVWHGSTDTPLTDRGRRQAARVGLHLERTRPGLTAVYASALQRARHTAEPIAARQGLAVETVDDLREYDLGAWEGKTYRELGRDHRLFERMNAEPDWRPGGGESARQVAERLAGAIRELAARHAGERIAIVTHGGALTLALGLLLDGDATVWRRVVENASVTDLVFGPAPQLRRLNHIDHLWGLR